MHIGEMHLDERNRHRRQRIAQRNAGMCVGRRIDDDGAHTLFACRMNALDQRPFMVALEGSSSTPRLPARRASAMLMSDSVT
jgi:hypothetical protein